MAKYRIIYTHLSKYI